MFVSIMQEHLKALESNGHTLLVILKMLQLYDDFNEVEVARQLHQKVPGFTIVEVARLILYQRLEMFS